MPEGKQVTAPNVLPGPAQAIWRSAFDSAYGGTCKSKSSEARDACAAAVAWSAVKETYRKDGSDWVEKTFVEREIDIKDIPLPGSLYNSPASAGLCWIKGYCERHAEDEDVAASASYGWAALNNQFAQDKNGHWTRKSEDAEPVSQPTQNDVETAEAEMAEPVIQRSIAAGASFQMEGTPIIVEDISESDEAFLVKNYGDELAERPSDWPWADWIGRTMLERTVGAVIRHRNECKAYLEAVERTKKRGWTAKVSQTGSDERVFSGWNVPGDGRQTRMKAVLVSKVHDGTDPDDWQLQIISNSFQSAFAVRAAPGMKRFRGPIIK
jgi:cation transport regulator ChaB